MKRFLGLLAALVLAASFLLLPAAGPVQAAETAIVVAHGGLNLRSRPSTGSTVLLVIPNGASVTVTDESSGGWYPVSYRGVSGWVAGDYLSFGGSASTASAGEIFDLNLPVPFRRQMTNVWCEAADVQAWYEYSTGRTVADSYTFQQEIWDFELANNLGFTVEQWNASPYAAAAAAHYRMPDRGFNHFIWDDAMDATRLMAWLIANPNYREPTMAAIWQGQHYILVKGVRAVGDPYLDYPNARILGVYVMDPNYGRPSWLGGDTYIPIDQWLRHFTPITYRVGPGQGVPGDIWQDRYVTMGRDWAPGGPTPSGRWNARPEYFEG